ncbi:hypothetical protein TSAR_003721 [Trichomalopsis sarcophagae]|uniref:Uncharacterized protein n=1 Tax=Trichomalopsis sarcophagae TaxID=543379 RepID=A0A232FD02_9HYME|nr:hypothetical protein TSAR_003721 [Trichomalopsis sarcophagae]
MMHFAACLVLAIILAGVVAQEDVHLVKDKQFLRKQLFIYQLLWKPKDLQASFPDIVSKAANFKVEDLLTANVDQHFAACLVLAIILAGVASQEDVHLVKDKQFLRKQLFIYQLLWKTRDLQASFPDIVSKAANFKVEDLLTANVDQDAAQAYIKVYNNGILPRGRSATAFYPPHLAEIKALFDVLYTSKDFETFAVVSTWSRDVSNQIIWFFSVVLASLTRHDTRRVRIPNVQVTLPSYFYNLDVFTKFNETQDDDQCDNSDNEIVAKYSKIVSRLDAFDPEALISYFTEDVGVENFYFYQSADVPFFMNRPEYDIDTYRRDLQASFPDIVSKAANFKVEDLLTANVDQDAAQAYIKVYNNGILPLGRSASGFYPPHLAEVKPFFDVLYTSKDFETFAVVSTWSRDVSNQMLWFFCVVLATLTRHDTRRVRIPNVHEILPNYFYNLDVLTKFNETQDDDQCGNSDNQIVAKYSKIVSRLDAFDPEALISYFTEDVGVENFYFYQSADVPFFMNRPEYDIDTYRRGERYFNDHKMFLARYNLERLSHGLGFTEDLDWNQNILTGYYPYMSDYNGIHFPQRPHNSPIPSFKQQFLTLVKQYQDRLITAADTGNLKGSNAPQGDEFFDDLMNAAQGNADSPDQDYYGSYDVTARHILGFNPEPTDPFHYIISALENLHANVRDPAFYRIYKSIVDIGIRYKARLPSYTSEDIGFSGVKIDSYDIDTYRRGERYFNDHKMFLARYNLERLSHGLGFIEDLDWNQNIQTGYYPYMSDYNGIPFPQRPHNSPIPSSKQQFLTLVKQYQGRLITAADTGNLKGSNASQGDVFFDDLMNAAQGNADSPDLDYYGSYEVTARHILGFNPEPTDPFHYIISALENLHANVRDPAFYRIYKSIVDIGIRLVTTLLDIIFFTHFHSYKARLPSYTSEDIGFSGVKIDSVSVPSIKTFFDEFDSILGYQNCSSNDEKTSVIVKQKRLNHEKFNVGVKVNSKVSTKAVVRIFIGPKFDKNDVELSLEQSQHKYFELDQFLVNLEIGDNYITRRDSEFAFQRPDDLRSDEFYDLIKASLANENSGLLVRQRPYGWPRRLIIPRGKPDGLTLRLFVIVNKFDEDKAVHTDSLIAGKGLLDSRSLGFPFDRSIDHLKFEGTNFAFKDIVVYHKH